MDRATNKRVLVLEDEAILRKNLTRLLERRGHHVLPAGSIREARELLRGESVDAAILDVGLPDGDGLQLLPAAGTDSSLVISAAVEPARLSEVGVAHFLPKPLELRSVERCIAELVAAGA